jgi:hypothetical protein
MIFTPFEKIVKPVMCTFIFATQNTTRMYLEVPLSSSLHVSGFTALSWLHCIIGTQGMRKFFIPYDLL